MGERNVTLTRLTLAAAAIISGAPAWSAPDAGTMDRSLLPTGTLRAAFIASNPVQAVADPQTAEVRGPAAELTRELARRLDAPFRIAGAQGAAGVIDAVKQGAADIGFLAFDPARAAELDFSRTYSLAQNSYVVLARSPIRSLQDIDRPGMRVGVAARDAGDLFLTRTLKHAELKRNPGGDLSKAVQMLAAGDIDAYAANRQRLSELASREPALRLLAENFYGVEQAIVVAKGNKALLATVNRLLDEARTSGLIAAAIQRAGLVGVDVAP
jgi:polar amino acid transport system substrate-binding protein